MSHPLLALLQVLYRIYKDLQSVSKLPSVALSNLVTETVEES